MNRFLIYSYHKALLFLSLLHFSSILIFILYHVQNSILKFVKIRLLDHVHFQLKHIISYLVEMNTIKSSHIWSPENTLSVQGPVDRQSKSLTKCRNVHFNDVFQDISCYSEN